MGESTPSVTVLTEYFSPEEASTAQLITELTTGLTDQFDLSVVTGRPSYHSTDRQTSVPRRETHDGLDITRVQATRFDKDALPLRVINWLSFTLLAFLQLIRRRDTDTVLTFSNPPILPFAAWLYGRLTGTPYVYVVYDMYPDMIVKLGYLSERNPLVRLWGWGMRGVYRDADRVVVLGDSMRHRLETKMTDESGFDVDDIAIIENWEDGDFIQPAKKDENDFAREQGTVDQFTLLYSGNVGRFHELETAIDAIGILEARGRTDAQLLIIGEGARKEALIERVERQGIDNVRFLPFQPLERLPKTLTCGDASLVGIKPEMAGTCVSSKLYSSLAAGMPVLAVVGEGDEVTRTVKACDCGEHVIPGDPGRAADILARWADNTQLVDRLGENARACFEERYTLDRALTEYAALLSAVVED